MATPKRTQTIIVAAGFAGLVAARGLAHCPSDSIFRIGVPYCLAAGACVGIGRLILPRPIRC